MRKKQKPTDDDIKNMCQDICGEVNGHDWVEVEDVEFSSEDFNKICMEIGCSEASCAMKPGKVNGIWVTYKKKKMMFHPHDHEVYAFGYNRVCVKCEEVRLARDELKEQLRVLFEKEAGRRDRITGRKEKAMKIWEKYNANN